MCCPAPSCSACVRAPGWSSSFTLAAFLLFILWVTMPLRTHAEGVVCVPENAEVRAAADGFVERVLVRPDAMVSAGDLLLSTSDPTLDAAVALGRARVQQFAVQYASLMFEERAQAAAIREDLARERVALERAEEKLDSLLVIAAVPGVLKLARAQDLPERYVNKGELLGYILSGPPRLVRVVVTQDDIALVRERRAEVPITDIDSELKISEISLEMFKRSNKIIDPNENAKDVLSHIKELIDTRVNCQLTLAVLNRMERDIQQSKPIDNLLPLMAGQFDDDVIMRLVERLQELQDKKANLRFVATEENTAIRKH